jgi:hypothetical protein
MATALEKQFDSLATSLHAMQKELILAKTRQARKCRKNIDIWHALSQKVSVSWDTISAVDEIISQREKQW